MKPDIARYFIAATAGVNLSTVYHSNMPDAKDTTYDNIIGVFSDGAPRVNVHTGIYIAGFEAIIRNTTQATAESYAQSIVNAVRSLHNRKTYYSLYLTAAMNNTSNPVSFSPDNGSGTSTSAAFATNDYILIGSEILKVTGVVTTVVSASRAQLGTTIASHSDNDEVKNITQSPIPGYKCDSTFCDNGIESLGVDDKGRWEYSVRWTVRLKP